MDLDKLKQAALKEFEKVKDLAELELARVKYLGRNSELSNCLRSLKDIAQEKRCKLGAEANVLRRELEEQFEKSKAKLSEAAHKTADLFDITHPARKLPHGHIHPLTKAQEDIMHIFATMGFRILEGPEVETEFNNFDALNIPHDHPARGLMDTFWIRKENSEKLLLRTHTSPMQVRFMQTHEPPFRILVPGRVYRNEATDMRHEWQFHQIEGLMVDRQTNAHPISIANLKGVMEYFFRQFFRDDVDVRFNASYFAFTEPSVEVYIKGKKGKLAGKWMEVAGAGMVHQNVFKAVGYVPGEYQGFAFGVALERLAMLKYKVDDIRLFHGSDIRFLEQMH